MTTKRLRSIVGGLVVSFVVTGCEVENVNGIVETEMRGQLYHIPAEYILSTYLPTSLVPRGPHMDQDEGVIIRIPLEALGIMPLLHEKPRGVENTIQFILYAPGTLTSNNEYDLNPDAYDAWMGTGSYHQRDVVFDEKTGLYRVYWRRGGKFWNYFVESPLVAAPNVVPQWVAGCSLPYGHNVEPEAEDMSNVDCSTSVSTQFGETGQIRFTGRHIQEVDAIREGVGKKIREWAVDD